jgi:PleD family two-component response regulator
MSPSSAATPDAINVLVADSNRMQAQLLTSALRRRSEFHVATCRMDILSIHQAVSTKLPSVAVLLVNQFRRCL